MVTRYISLLMCVMVALLALTGCSDSGESNEVSFKAIVLENNQTHLLVEPEEGSSELSSADRIMVSVSEATLLDSQDKEITIDDIKSGDLVQIDYDGQIAESYPAQISGCSRVKVLQSSDEQEGDDSDGFAQETQEIPFEKGFYRPDFDSLPEEIANWVNYSLEIPCVQGKMHGGDRYVLITEGMKPSGGYEVKVEEVLKHPDRLEVKVKSTSPREGEPVDTMITCPFDLIIVEEDELPLAFTDVDDPDRYFMKLLGLEKIDRPIVASSDWIKIFSPRPEEKIEGAISLAGIACVFEGNVSYELLAEDNNVLHKGFTTAAMGDWGYFEEEIPVPADYNGDRLILQLYSVSGKDGSKMFIVDIPLYLP